MPGVIGLPEFLSDDLAYQRTGPNPCFQTISCRPATMLIPVIDPQRNGTAMHLQVISYFSRGLQSNRKLSWCYSPGFHAAKKHACFLHGHPKSQEAAVE